MTQASVREHSISCNFEVGRCVASNRRWSICEIGGNLGSGRIFNMESTKDTYLGLSSPYSTRSRDLPGHPLLMS
eukprot:scaffold52749_cov94-Cyclotella_meneghiniana.AAC.1